MNNISFAQIQEKIDSTDLKTLPTLNISILRNIMIDSILPYIRYQALNIGFNAEVTFSEYDTVFQDAVGGNNELLNDKTDVLLMFLYLETLSPSLCNNFASLSHDEVKKETERVLSEVGAIIDGVRKQTDAMILWYGFELPLEPSLGIFDRRSDSGQRQLIEQMNNQIAEHINHMQNAFFIDSNLLLARIGSEKYYDERFWHIGRAPYTREALRVITDEIYKYVRALKGKNKKCLVLDCDNTLWGGIVGEDGIDGVQLGQTHPGSSFYEFQQEILSLYNRGIILALCSKNNEQDVWDMFNQHPDMLLKEKHIATYQINWNDKATNIRQIASDLNIGIDSIVFADDSDFEVNLVRTELPEVAVIQLPKSNPTSYRKILASCGLFDTLTISAEDKKRGEMYKAEQQRKVLATSTTDMASYYKSLEMKLEIKLANSYSIPRIAQQTQKTNQFNLTTRRYSEADIQKFVESDEYDVLSLRLSDRFGDSGIVGTCILRYKDKTAYFDSFLLSCRVLGRGVEDAFLIHALKMSIKKGCTSAIGEYYVTKKNGQVKNFFPERNFETVTDNGSEADGVYKFDLSKELQKESEYFREIISDVE